jgi:hypothetical protein
VRPTAADAFDEARGFFAFEDRPVKEPRALWQRMGSFDFTLGLDAKQSNLSEGRNARIESGY